ncbi:MAG: YeeE/YedE family protein [Gammaproteobacteria bacterium]|nr:YeeE/YedE family protein [Gammaproteobacteria bacterium]
MEIALYSQYLIWFFVIAAIFGALANKTHFCTMGAVADWANFHDLNRMRSWVLAIGLTVIGLGLLEYFGLVDISLTASNETSTPPYRFTNFVWLRHLVGGVMFGIGMTLGSGCGNKTLVRIGEGNMKAVVVFTMIMAGASLMFFTNFDYLVFLQWMNPLSIDFGTMGASGQDVASVFFAVTDTEDSANIRLLAALLVGGTQLVWVFMSSDFRQQPAKIVTGIVVCLLVLSGWYLTAGEGGLLLIEEIEFMDQPPYASGAQSVTFIGPTAHLAQYVYSGFSAAYLSLGVMLLVGVVAGSFIYSLVRRRIRLEWFVTWDDFFRHVIGGLLMGIGGVLALGCTIGQGISGFSTLALGSFVAIAAIVVSSMMTMKYQYYRMLYDESPLKDVIITVMVDMRMLPGRFRRLEDL